MLNDHPATADLPAWYNPGLRILYRGADTRCPGCSKRQWLVGRATAQCAFCATALPLDHASGFGFSPRFDCRARRPSQIELQDAA